MKLTIEVTDKNIEIITEANEGILFEKNGEAELIKNESAPTEVDADFMKSISNLQSEVVKLKQDNKHLRRTIQDLNAAVSAIRND